MESSAFYELEALRLVARRLANIAKSGFFQRISSRHSGRNSLPVPNGGLESQYLWASTSGALLKTNIRWFLNPGTQALYAF